jgi:hypothetical protein
MSSPVTRLKWRPWLRALHRDIGYFAVGFTVIYALSGLAVNHIADWDPNFTQISRKHQLQLPLPSPDPAASPEQRDQQLAQAILTRLAIEDTPTDVYPADGRHLEITLPKGSTLHVDLESGAIVEDGQKERFFLRLANWLHLNRGKAAWKYLADGYAVFLLFLAISGLFMIPGRKGLLGRGALIALIGVLLPVAYVVASGGPGGTP